MKKVTLGLLITFVAVAMVAGPKPTPTPAVQKGRGIGIAAHKEAGTPVGGALKGRDSLKGSTKETAPTPSIHEPALGGPDTARTAYGVSGKSTKEEGGKNDGEKNVTPSASGNAEGQRKKVLDGGPVRETAPGTPMPTPGTPVGVPNKGWETHEIKVREMAPTAKPNPRENTPTDVQPFGSGTNKADLKGEPPVKPSPAVGPVNAISLNSSRSNIVDERQAHGTSQYQAARVLSQQGRRLIVQLGNGQRVVVDSSSLNPAPRVGSTVTVTNSRGNWVVVTR